MSPLAHTPQKWRFLVGYPPTCSLSVSRLHDSTMSYQPSSFWHPARTGSTSHYFYSQEVIAILSLILRCGLGNYMSQHALL